MVEENVEANMTLKGFPPHVVFFGFNKVPTWDNIQKCRLEGLGHCTMCKSNEGIVFQHILKCSFANMVS